MKVLHERNESEQKSLILAYFDRANRTLLEKEKLQRSRKKNSSIDIVINQDSGCTELYIPVKKGQKGRLTNLIQKYCQETFAKYSRRKLDEGVFHNYIVFG